MLSCLSGGQWADFSDQDVCVEKRERLVPLKDPSSAVNEFQCVGELTSHKVTQWESVISDSAYPALFLARSLGTSLVASFHTDKDKFQNQILSEWMGERKIRVVVNSDWYWLLPFKCKSNCLLCFLNNSGFSCYNKWQRYSGEDLVKYNYDKKATDYETIAPNIRSSIQRKWTSM